MNRRISRVARRVMAVVAAASLTACHDEGENTKGIIVGPIIGAVCDQTSEELSAAIAANEENPCIDEGKAPIN